MERKYKVKLPPEAENIAPVYIDILSFVPTPNLPQCSHKFLLAFVPHTNMDSL